MKANRGRAMWWALSERWPRIRAEGTEKPERRARMKEPVASRSSSVGGEEGKRERDRSEM